MTVIHEHPAELEHCHRAYFFFVHVTSKKTDTLFLLSKLVVKPVSFHLGNRLLGSDPRST